MREATTVRTTPETVRFGYFDTDADPVGRVPTGEPVVVDTVNIFQEDHVGQIVAGGIPREDVLDDERTIARRVPHEGPGPHVVTGPIHVEGARPGDVLEVSFDQIDLRAPYGRNRFLPGAGALPEYFSEPDTSIIPIDRERGVAVLEGGIEVPVDPFFGIVAVTPSTDEGRIDSLPPSEFGGNLDNKDLTEGSSVYFPVAVEGAHVYLGDGHGAQGNGEVDVNGVETSLRAELEFTVHEGAYELTFPIAETDEHYITMGLDEDLDTAARLAVEETIDFLGTQQGIAPEAAYRIASLAVDFNITQVVNHTKGVHGLIPKHVLEAAGPVTFSA